MIDWYKKWGNVESTEFLFNQMSTRNIISWTTIMTAYSRNKRYSNVIVVFHDMINKGIIPDKVTMTTVILACAH